MELLQSVGVSVHAIGVDVLRALYPKTIMIMSEKTQPDQQTSAPGELCEQVPEWLRSALIKNNEQVMQEKLPEDLVILLKQIESNERHS